MIKSYHVDAVIFSCTGLDGDLGATDSNEANSLIKQAMIASAERRILVADGEKFGKKSFVSICPIDDIDTIVTDREPSAAWMSLCAEKNIELVYRKDAI
jgi:DeoR/GlpR family transcriptional regulator of sugar metabolism